jgi:hypothetical protein
MVIWVIRNKVEFGVYTLKLSKASHKRLAFDQADVTIREEPELEEEPETVQNDPVHLAKELAYLLLTQPPASQNDSDTFTKEVGLFTSGTWVKQRRFKHWLIGGPVEVLTHHRSHFCGSRKNL